MNNLPVFIIIFAIATSLISCDKKIKGCTDPSATNFNPNATENDGSCSYIPETVIDIDGNVYHTIVIGSQVWMIENLRVTKYRNGTPIPEISDSSQWMSDSTGAYCNYNNDLNHASTYGHLYNWYAVVNPNNICPEGWHVPTYMDWEKLSQFVFENTNFSGGLKETGLSHWKPPNSCATNTSGFTALPGGGRIYGGFYFMGDLGTFWSSDKINEDLSIVYILHNDNCELEDALEYHFEGYSIRCIMDGSY